MNMNIGSIKGIIQALILLKKGQSYPNMCSDYHKKAKIKTKKQLHVSQTRYVEPLQYPFFADSPVGLYKQGSLCSLRT